MKKNTRVKIFKIILAILVLALIIGMIVYLFPVVKNMSSLEGQIAFKEKIDNMGVYGILALFGLQFAQIFLIIIPGEPIEIFAGMCYGAFWGTIFIMLSVFIISTAIFLLVRKYERKFIYNFYSEEKISKMENSKLFKDPKRIELIILILFLIPGTPKDLIVYISALLPIKPSRFIIISNIARIPSIVSSTLAGSNIVIGNWEMSIFLYVAVLFLVVVSIFIINKFDKTKSTEDVIKSISEK